jgi:hypothetical protein
MLLNMREQTNSYKDMNINISYSGPMWEDGIIGLSEMVRTSLSGDDLPLKASKAIFSVFVEQVTNMLMYSEEKDANAKKSNEKVAMGMMVLGNKGKTYFIQTGNAIKSGNAHVIAERIDYLNTLDKKGLRQYHREKLRTKNDNPDSKGAGLGLIEIARRASAPIKYSFEKLDEKFSYFSMYVEISQEEAE